MKIYADYPDKEIMVYVQCPLNAGIAIRMKWRIAMKPKRPVWLEECRKNVLKHPVIGIQTLSHDLIECFSLSHEPFAQLTSSYGRHRGQLPTEKVFENGLAKTKKLLIKVKLAAEAHIIWCPSKEANFAKSKSTAHRISGGLTCI
nr:hypothetical protein HmN_000155600 [Hymenolepis microstoma]